MQKENKPFYIWKCWNLLPNIWHLICVAYCQQALYDWGVGIDRPTSRDEIESNGAITMAGWSRLHRHQPKGAELSNSAFSQASSATGPTKNRKYTHGLHSEKRIPQSTNPLSILTRVKCNSPRPFSSIVSRTPQLFWTCLC